MNRIVLSAAIVSSMAGAAFAQTSTAPTPSTTTPTTTTSAPSSTAPRTGAAPTATTGADTSSTGMKMADTAAVGVKFVTTQAADFMATRLMGAKVYNNQNESIGEIEDLIIENGRTVKGVVVSVGGFLGMGDNYVVLDPSTVVLNQHDGKWRAYIDTSKDNLKNAPKFTYKKMKK